MLFETSNNALVGMRYCGSPRVIKGLIRALEVKPLLERRLRYLNSCFYETM